MRRRARAGDHCWEAVLDGAATPATAAHLAGCPPCRARVAGVQRAAAMVRAQAPPPSPDLGARVLGALGERAGPGPARRPPRSRRGEPRRRDRDGAEAIAVRIVPS